MSPKFVDFAGDRVQSYEKTDGVDLKWMSLEIYVSYRAVESSGNVDESDSGDEFLNTSYPTPESNY